MRIVLIGMKGCGKTTVGRLLAETLRLSFIDADTEAEHVHQQERGEALAFRQIFRQYGETYFQALETRTLKRIAREREHTDYVFACGGRTPLQEENREIIPRLGTIIFLHVDRAVLLKRILAQGIPPFFPYQDDAEKSLDELLTQRVPAYKTLADLTIDVGEETSEEVMSIVLKGLRAIESN
jgi:shikimate kinase